MRDVVFLLHFTKPQIVKTKKTLNLTNAVKTLRHVLHSFPQLLNDGDMAVEMQFDFSGKSRDRTEMPYAIAKGVELIKQMGDSSPLFRGRQISEADVWWILAKTMGRLGKQGSKNPALSAEMQVKIDAIAEAHVDDPPAFCLDYSLHIFGALNPHSETLCSISFGAFLGFVEHLHTTVADDVRDGDILHEVLPDLQKIVEVLATKDGVEKSIGPFVWLVLGWKGNSDDVAVKAHYIYAEHLAILKKLDPNGNAPFVELLQLDSAKKIWQPLVHRRIIDGKGPPPFEFPEIPEQGPPLELVPGLHPQTAITIARGWWTASFTAAVVAGHPHSSSGVSSDEAFRVALDVLSAYVSDDLDIRKVLVEFLDEFTPLTVDDKSVYGKYDCLLRRLAVCRGNSAISWLELGKRGGVNFKGKPYTPQQSFVEAIQKCPNVHDSEGFSAWKGLLDTMPGGAAPASPGGYK